MPSTIPTHSGDPVRVVPGQPTEQVGEGGTNLVLKQLVNQLVQLVALTGHPQEWLDARKFASRYAERDPSRAFSSSQVSPIDGVA